MWQSDELDNETCIPEHLCVVLKFLYLATDFCESSPDLDIDPDFV